MRVSSTGQVQTSRGTLDLAAPVATVFEQALATGLDWAARGRAAVGLLVLHLSHLHAPGPRPHHRRVAASLFDDLLRLHGGQMFRCPNGDLLLLTDPTAAGQLVRTLFHLFRAEAPGADRLLALWSLPADEAVARASLGRDADAPVDEEDAPVPLGAFAAVEAVLASAPADALVRRQTAIRLTRDGMVPIYQELSVSLAALESRAGTPVPFAADPFLFRHLAARLDRRVLEMRSSDAFGGGRRLHLNLTVPGILSPAFDACVARLPPGAVGGIEVRFMEAVADLPRFALAARVLRDRGVNLVIDGLDHAGMAVSHPAALAPDMLKLDWSPRMAALPGRERRLLAQAVAAFGADRIVLHRAETEAAVAWGRSHGISQFQGRHVDAMLAAARLSACAYAAGCTLRQCIDRAAATGPAGRADCRNQALLAATIPAQLVPTVPAIAG